VTVGNSGKPALHQAANGTETSPRLLVSLTGVEKHYESDGSTQQVLTGLDMEIETGEIVVVLGRSGSGKTTLLNILGALDRPDGGQVVSCGVDLATASAKQLVKYRAQSIGFVFQFYNLLPNLTAVENIEAGLRVTDIDRDAAQERARSMLARVELAGAEHKFPAQLSGGEQQRVAIARAFARAPQLLLADEPTGNLDDENAAHVVSLMRELAVEAGTSTVVVTHDTSLTQIATRTMRMTHGVLTDDES
jgi:putative ABC transport system ATP-binding protein